MHRLTILLILALGMACDFWADEHPTPVPKEYQLTRTASELGQVTVKFRVAKDTQIVTTFTNQSGFTIDQLEMLMQIKSQNAEIIFQQVLSENALVHGASFTNQVHFHNPQRSQVDHIKLFVLNTDVDGKGGLYKGQYVLLTDTGSHVGNISGIVDYKNQWRFHLNGVFGTLQGALSGTIDMSDSAYFSLAIADTTHSNWYGALPANFTQEPFVLANSSNDTIHLNLMKR
ncbi:hypothetical protein [Marinoscillum furvescens]|uniref:Uncharacterized protein n=1 Tax=Marinoscillum furvescens DSM 4134 TaxID=1122208 RepID=A0A3D9L4K0_MARFU|nr:hypothetical protein [Marinoscillum furvescens]RED97870.1 hypothetical protein C7460_11111 [Marinoscillum furvescens DSM 4134]